MFKELIKKKKKSTISQSLPGLFIYLFWQTLQTFYVPFPHFDVLYIDGKSFYFCSRENWLVFRPLLVNMRTGGKLEGLKDWDLSWRNEGQWGLGPKRKSSIRVSELSNHNPAGPPIRTTELSPFFVLLFNVKDCWHVKNFLHAISNGIKRHRLVMGFHFIVIMYREGFQLCCQCRRVSRGFANDTWCRKRLLIRVDTMYWKVFKH